MRTRLALLVVVPLILSVLAIAPARAVGSLTVTVSEGGVAVEGAFVAVVPSAADVERVGSVTDATGAATFPDLADGAYTVLAASPGRSVGAAAATVPTDTAVDVAITASGNPFDGLGAYGGQVGTVMADGQSGVFYATVTAIPSIYRTVDYGASWTPVTISTDDPDGIDGTGTAQALTTSGVAGEVATIVDGTVWFSTDYGVSWQSATGPTFANTDLLWGHVGDVSVILMTDPSSALMKYVDPTAATPSVVDMPASFKAAASDRVWLAPGGSRPWLGVLNSTSSSVVLYALDSSPAPGDTDLADPDSTTIDLTGTDVDGSAPTILRIGGDGTAGQTVGDHGTTPNAILAYSSAANGAKGGAVVARYDTGTWSSTTSVTLYSQADDTPVAGTPDLKNSCQGPPEEIVGSVSPLGDGGGSIGMCWASLSGGALQLRPVNNINNNTGLAFDAGYDGATNSVLLSGDGSKGIVKSARQGSLGGEPPNRPYVPSWPQLASAGTDPASGGVAVEGIDAAVIKDVSFGPGGADQISVVLSFSGGGRTLASTDAGDSWFTVLDTGGSSIDWWEGATTGSSWLVAGHDGAGDLLAAADVDTAAPGDLENALQRPGGSRSLPGTSGADFGLAGDTTGVKLSAIEGLDGTDRAYVAAMNQPPGSENPSGGTLRRVSFSGSATNLPDDRAAAVSNPGELSEITLGVGSLTSCPDDGSAAASVAGKVFAGLRSSSTTDGGVAVIGDAAGASPTVTMADDAKTAAAFAEDVTDVRVACGAGIVWAALGSSPSPGKLAMAMSTDGGATFEQLSDAIGPSFTRIETLAVTDDGTELVALSPDGGVAASADGGGTWAPVNDPGNDEDRHFGAERPGDVDLPDEAVAPAGVGVAALGAGSALVGTGAGLFSASVIDGTAPSAPSVSALADPLLADANLSTAGSQITVGWSAASDPQSGVLGYQLSSRKAGFGSSSWSSWALAGTTSSRSRGFTATGGNRYCFKVRAQNNVGLFGAFSSPRCTTVPADDRDLSASSSPAWAKRTGQSGTYRGTLREATGTGATLRSGVRQATRVVVIATRCPGCGTVEVLLRRGDGSVRRLGTLNLAASSVQKRQLLKAWEGSAVTGTVIIRVTSSAKPVRIDGLHVQRTWP